MLPQGRCRILLWGMSLSNVLKICRPGKHCAWCILEGIHLLVIDAWQSSWLWWNAIHVYPRPLYSLLDIHGWTSAQKYSTLSSNNIMLQLRNCTIHANLRGKRIFFQPWKSPKHVDLSFQRKMRTHVICTWSGQRWKKLATKQKLNCSQPAV